MSSSSKHIFYKLLSASHSKLGRIQLTVQRQYCIVSEQQIQPPQRLSPFASHLVLSLPNSNIIDVVQTSVTAFFKLGIFLNGLENLPAIIAVFLIASEAVCVEERLKSRDGAG
jgi:hypothetical protein